jgi:hypothetical protein
MIQSFQNPRGRVNAKSLEKFSRYATPDEKAQMQRLLTDRAEP